MKFWFLGGKNAVYTLKNRAFSLYGFHKADSPKKSVLMIFNMHVISG